MTATFQLVRPADAVGHYLARRVRVYAWGDVAASPDDVLVIVVALNERAGDALLPAGLIVLCEDGAFERVGL